VPDSPEGNKKSRREGLQEPIEMPQHDAEHIVSYLFEIGPTVGETALTHSEIDAWQRNTGIELDAWETRFVKRLSVEYLAESQRATKSSAPAPWADAPYVKSLVSNSLMDSIKRLAEL